MRPLTFQVKLPAMGKATVELSPPKCSPSKASPSAFGEVLHGARSRADWTAPHGDRGATERDREHGEDDPADPHVRHSAQLGPPPGLAQGPVAGQTVLPQAPAAGAAPARVSLEDLLPALVRRVAWSGDGRRGTVRLELGSGALAGAELVVHADEGRVRVQLRAPPGVDLGPLRERIGARLAARGVAIDEVE
jgi:hypothetical protein